MDVSAPTSPPAPPPPIISSTSPAPTTSPPLPSAAPPTIRFPPLPRPSPSTQLIPFSTFKEHGIQIFADPHTGIELDGLGIPTVRLRVPHDTDVCKTTAKGRGRGKKNKGVGEDEGEEEDEEEDAEDDENENADADAPNKHPRKKKKKPSTNTPSKSKSNRNRKNTALPIDLSTIADPVERAQEQKRQRLLLFAKQEWWEQWAAGEDLRRGRPNYDSSLPAADRIHMAATDFRTGRIWPPASSQVKYLWDQFRLYTGLLGSPPVWKRVDLVQSNGAKTTANDEEDNDVSDDEESFARQSASKPISKPKPKEQRDRTPFESDFADDDPEAVEEEEAEAEERTPPRSQQTPHKRVPPRAPYALYAYTPILIPHLKDKDLSKPPTQDHLTALAQSQIPLLLSLASSLRHTRLLTFLSSPVQVISEFLSSYVYSQGLIYSAPARMVGVGRLVLFFLDFVLRVGALKEESKAGQGMRKGGGGGGERGRMGVMEREFASAAEVARRAALEIPRAGWIVRVCPDVVGRGAEGVWGRVWREEEWWSNGVGAGAGAGDEMDGEVNGDGSKTGEEEEDEDEAARVKRFEDELRAANVQLVSGDPLELGVPPLHEDINIEVVSPLSPSPGYIASSDSEGGDDEEEEGQRTPRASIVEVVDEDVVLDAVVGSDTRTNTHAHTNAYAQIPGDLDTHAPVPAPVPVPVPGASTATDQTTRLSSELTEAKVKVKTEADMPPSTNVEGEAAKGDGEQGGDDVTRSGSSSESARTDHKDEDNSEAKDMDTHISQQETKKEEDEEDKEEDERSPWLPPAIQPLFSVLGSMSAFPFRFAPGGPAADVGCAERSVRRVKEVIMPASAAPVSNSNSNAKKWTGSGAANAVEEALVDALARVVLEPWVDWDDAGCVGDMYRVPRVQGPRALTREEEEVLAAAAAAASPSTSPSSSSSNNNEDDENNEEGESENPTPTPESPKLKQIKQILHNRAKYAHDPVQEEITVVLEPRVAEALSVGMGLVGTWVQLVPVAPPASLSLSSSSHLGSGGRGRGRGRGRGQGRGGRGRGRGGGAANPSQPQPPQKQNTLWYIEHLHMAVPSFWTVPPPDVPGSLLAEGEELRRMFYESVEAGEGGGAGGGGYGDGGEAGGGGREVYVDEMDMEMGLGMVDEEEDEFSD